MRYFLLYLLLLLVAILLALSLAYARFIARWGALATLPLARSPALAFKSRPSKTKKDTVSFRILSGEAGGTNTSAGNLFSLPICVIMGLTESLPPRGRTVWALPLPLQYKGEAGDKGTK